MRRCSVPGCRSNFRPPYVSVFSFPKDPNISKLWLKNIGRPTLKIHENIGVCIKHFEKHVICGISSSDSHRKKVTIKHGSVPTIFEDDPSSYEDCNVEGTMRSLDKNARIQKSAKNPLSSGSDSHLQKSPKGDSSQNSPVKYPKKLSPTTDRPIIAVIKAQDPMAEDNITLENMDEDDHVMELPSSSSTSFSLPSPFKNLPNVSVCLKEEDRVPFTRELKGIKRSPSTGSNSSTGSSEQKPGAITKRRKIEKPAPVVLGRDNDCYCWVCHRENTVLNCIACPRAYHVKCAGEMPCVSSDWVCPECQRVLAAENVDTRSSTLAEISLDKLGALLKLSLNKMKQRAPPAFHQPVSLEQYPLYLHYVIHPMDLSLLEKNIKNKVYGCTEAFLADVKWIAHNSCVFNGTQYPLSNIAKNLVKGCEQDMQEIEVCPDCFVHSIVRNKYWFSEVCRKPHPLVWAKLKGFPYWPAKVVRIVDGNVDARFFGAHDRAWVPVSQCYHLSKEMPTTSKPKKKGNYEAALDELNVHVHIIIQKFGCFEYAAYRTVFNPENKYLMYHGIDIDKASKEEISFDTAASPSKMRFQSPEKENRFASFMEAETEKSNIDEEKLQGGLLKDSTKVLNSVKESPLSFFFKDRLIDSSTTPKEKGLAQKSSEKSSVQEKRTDTAEEKQSTSKAPTLGKPEAISDSDQLRKLELVLERIKGYVSPNVDTEKDSFDDKNMENEKIDEEKSSSETDNNGEKKKTRQAIPKSSPIGDSFLLPIIEKSKATENVADSTENINVSAAEKKDSLKLNNIIESCKAMLGISNVTDDVDNESVADENASRSDDEEDDTSSSEADEESSSLSEGEDEDETRNAEASDEEADDGAEVQIVKGDASSEAEVTDDSDYEGEVEEESSSESSGTDIEDDSIKGKLSKKTNETPQYIDNAHEMNQINDASSTNPDAELSKDCRNDSSKLEDNEESSSMDVIDNPLQSEENHGQAINLKSASLGKVMHAVPEVQADAKIDNSNQETENLIFPAPSILNKPTSLGEFASPKHDTPTLQKKNIKYEAEDGYHAQHTSNHLSKSATDNHQPSNNEEDDDEIIICDSPPRPKTPPVIVLDDDQENEDSLVSDTHAIRTSPYSTSAESLVNDESSVTCRTNYDNDHNDSSSQKHVLVNGNASKIEGNLLKGKAPESTSDKKRNLSFDDSSEDDIQIVTAVKRSKLTGAIRTFNKPDGSPLISALPRQEFLEENLGKENLSPVKNQSPSPNKEQSSDFGEDSATPPVTPSKNPVIDTSHLSDKDKEILFLKSKLKCVFRAYHIQAWKCTQEREELRHNMNLIIMEMRACLEADKKQAIEALTRTFEQEKLKSIEETKKKQWCASCRLESRYACCWNTSYCSINCQKRHFPEHKAVCTQVKNRYTSIGSDSVEGKQKVVTNLAENSEKGNKLIILNMKTSEPAKNVPDLSSVSSQQNAANKPQIQVVAGKNPLQVSSSQCTSSPVQFIIAPVKSSTAISSAAETIKPSSSLPLTTVQMPTMAKSPALSTVPSSVPTPIQSSPPILVSSSVKSLSTLTTTTTSVPSTITNEEQQIAQVLLHVPRLVLPKVIVNDLSRSQRSYKNDAYSIHQSQKLHKSKGYYTHQIGQTTIINPIANSGTCSKNKDQSAILSNITSVKFEKNENSAANDPDQSRHRLHFVRLSKKNSEIIRLSKKNTEIKKPNVKPMQRLFKTSTVKSSSDHDQPSVELSFTVSSDNSSSAVDFKELILEPKHQLNEETVVSSLDEFNKPMVELAYSISTDDNAKTQPLNEHMLKSKSYENIALDESEDKPTVQLSFTVASDDSSSALDLKELGLEPKYQLNEETVVNSLDDIRDQPTVQLSFTVASDDSSNALDFKELGLEPKHQLNEETVLSSLDDDNKPVVEKTCSISTDDLAKTPHLNERMLQQSKSYKAINLDESEDEDLFDCTGFTFNESSDDSEKEGEPDQTTDEPVVELACGISTNDSEQLNEHKLQQSKSFEVITLDESEDEDLFDCTGFTLNESSDESEKKNEPDQTTEDEDWFDSTGFTLNESSNESEKENEPGHSTGDEDLFNCTGFTFNGTFNESSDESEDKNKLDQATVSKLYTQPFNMPLNENTGTQESNKGLEIESSMKLLSEGNEVEPADKSNQKRVFGVEKCSAASKKHNPETLPPAVVTNDTVVLPLEERNWAENFVVPWDKMPVKFLCTLSMKKKPTLLEVANMTKIISDAIQEVNQNPSEEDLIVISRNVVQKYPLSFPNGEFGNLSLVQLLKRTFDCIKKEKKLNSIEENESCKKSDISNKQTVTGASGTNSLQLLCTSLIEIKDTKASDVKTEAENVQQLSKISDVNPLSDSGQKTIYKSETNSEILKIQEIISSETVNSDWTKNFVIPWSEMPEKFLKAVSEKQRPCPVDEHEMISIITNSIREITPTPGKRALSVICRNIVKKYPDSFKDRICGKVVVGRYASLLNQMQSKFIHLDKRFVFKKKRKRKPFKKTCASKMTPLRNVLSSNLPLNKSIESLKPNMEFKAENVHEVCSFNESDMENKLEKEIGENASSCKKVLLPLLKKYWAEDFAIPWYKMPEHLLQACDKKQRPSPIDRRKFVKIVVDSIQEIRLKPGRYALSIICKNIVQKYPESFCDMSCGEVIGCGYTTLLKQVETRLVYLNRGNKFIQNKQNRNSCSGIDVSNKVPIHNPVNSHLPSTSTDENKATQESETELEVKCMQQLKKSSKINNLVGFGGEANLLHSNGFTGSPKVQDITLSQNNDLLPLVDPKWAESFDIPWYKMPNSVLCKLSAKKRLSKNDRQLMIKNITDSIQLITPNPTARALAVVSRKIVQKYPESISDIINGKVICGRFSFILKHMMDRFKIEKRKLNNQIGNKCEETLFPEMIPVTNASSSLYKLSSTVPVNEKEDIQMSPTALEHMRYSQKNNSLNESGELINQLPIERCPTKNKKNVSSPAANLLSVDPKWAVKFPIPWYKMSNAFLCALAEGKRPSIAAKHNMIRNIVDSIQVITPKPEREALKVVCRKIVQKYPESLSDMINGEIVRGGYSSILKIMSVRLGNLSREKFRKQNIKRPPEKNDVNAMDESISTNIQNKSCSGTSKDQGNTCTKNHELLYEDWTLNYAIPWNEMPKRLLQTLAAKKRPSPSDRHNMIRIISNSILKITKKPKKWEVSVICKNIVQKYPESFCDTLLGEVVGEGYASLLNQMVTRINNINRKRAFYESKWNRKSCEKTEVPSKIASYMPPNQCEEIQEFKKEFKKLPISQTYELNSSEECDKEMLLDKSSSDSMKADSISSYQDTKSLANSDPDWAENFVVPWNQMPVNLLSIISSKRRPSPNERRKIIRIISHFIREISLEPREKELSVICKKIVQKYPESFSDTLCGDTAGEGYSTLLKQIIAKFKHLNRTSTFNKIPLSKNPCEETVPKNITNIDCCSEMELKQCSVHLNRCEETELVQHSYKDPKISLLDESGPIIERDDDSLSGITEYQLNWVENFSIPWNTMPEKLFNRLNEKQRLSRSEKLNAIRIISNSIQKFTIKPGKEALSTICKKIIEKYPDSFSDTLPGETAEEAYSSVLKLMEKRFENLNTEIIYFKDVPDVIPLDDSEDEDWSHNKNLDTDESSSESEDEEREKHFTTVQATGVLNAAKNAEQSPSWAEDFSIPWNKLPNEILSILTAKGRPSLNERRKMLRILSYAIAEVNPKPGTAALSVICRNIVKTYPDSFKDMLYGEVIGEGYSSVLRQMVKRFDNINRKHKLNKDDCSDHDSCDEIQYGEVIGESSPFVSNQMLKSKLNKVDCNNYHSCDEIPDDETQTLKEKNMELLSKRSEISILNESGQTIALHSDKVLPYVAPNWEEKFVIPWSKMPKTLLQALAEKKQLNPNDRKHLINIISNSIREITLKPGKKALSVICRNIIQKYPESFSDEWCGKVTNDCFSLLLEQMIKRCNDLNKSANPFRMIVESRKSIKGSNVSANIRLHEYYGCVNWQPLYLPENETEKTQKLKKETMQSLFQQGLKSLDLNHYKKLLTDTYFSLRKDINNGHPISFLQKEWPLLFIKDGLLCHFKMLVGVNVLDKLSAAYSSKGPLISSFLMTKPVGCDKKMIIDVLAEINKEKNSTVENKIPSFAVVISLLMSYFGEAKELLFMPVDVSSTVDQIENILKNKPSNLNIPCLICCGNTMWSSKSYMLSIDSTVVNSDINCFEVGLAMLFASFFVFNLEYPKIVGATLEFIQRCFLGMNPSKGTKVKGGNGAPNSKVMKLINNINDFRWHV